MKNKTKNGIALVLASSLALSSLGGCSNNKEKNSSSISSVDYSSPTSIVEDVDSNLGTHPEITAVTINNSSLPTHSKNVELKSDSLSLDVVYTPDEVLDRLNAIYDKSQTDFEFIISNRNNEDKLLFASALLKKLESNGVSRQEIIRELNNIMYLRLFPTDFDDETWNELFGKLCGTVDEFTNVTDYYYPLANTVHLYSCGDKHEVIDDTTSCDSLQKELADFLSDISYQNFIYDALVECGNSELLSKYEKLISTGVNMEFYLCELDNLFVLSANPTDFDDDTWDKLFGNLNKTLGDTESLFEEYYELARFIHLLSCTFEHHDQEFGSTSCEGFEYIYK